MERPVRTASLVAVAALVAMTTVACVAGGGSPPAGLSCAWPNKTTKETLNVAYPDSGATYWSMGYNLLAGDQIMIDGTYPDARYMSFITYNLAGNVVDSITDSAIDPDAGSQNPFSDASATPGGSYHLEVINGVGAGTPDDVLATGGFTGTVIYRSYVSSLPGDPTGGVGLPNVSVRRTDGSVVPIGTCTTPTADASVVDLINLFGPATDLPAQHPPEFKRPATVAGLFANPDNGYIAAVSAHQNGRVLVMKGRAPVVPDTSAGQSPALGGTDMRYWSMCTNEYRKPYPVTDCAYDSQVPLDANGEYTIVTSMPADRPTNATSANGVTWLDWGSTAQDMVLIMRNMLPSPTFHQSVFDVAPGQPASSAMGPYAPVTAECDTATYEAGGAAACGLA